MDRKKGAGAPPGELGSFDLAKMSEAEVAAQIAARMVQWRRAHKRSEAPPRGPEADRPIAAQPAMRPSTPPPSLGEAAAIRIDRALRLAASRLGPQTEVMRMRSARRASAYRMDFEALLAEGPNMNAAGMRPEKRRIGQALGQALDRACALGAAARQGLRRSAKGGIGEAPARTLIQALTQARALSLTAWHAPLHWPAIAGAALLAAALAGWILMPLERSVAPDVASAPKVTMPPVALHPPDPAPTIAGLAGQPTPASEALTRTRQEAIPPEKVAARAAPPAPAWRGPTLFARLKPPQPAAPPAPTQPSAQATKPPDTRQPDTVPLTITLPSPQAPKPSGNPHRMEQ